MMELWAIAFMLHGNPYVSMDMWTTLKACEEVLDERRGLLTLPDDARCILREIKK